MLPAPTCLVYNVLGEINGTQITELVYRGFDAESTISSVTLLKSLQHDSSISTSEKKIAS